MNEGEMNLILSRLLSWRAAKMTPDPFSSPEVSTRSRLLPHKFAVIDSRWEITGSFNWTVSAENQNRENLVILDCPDLARSFTAEWELIRPDEP